MSSSASGQDGGLSAAMRGISEHALALAKLEVRLAKLEVAAKLKLYGAAVAVGIASLILVLFAVGFGLAAAVSGLDAVLPRWLALLIVGAGLLVLAGPLVAVALAALRRAAPPAPTEALEEVKETRRLLEKASER